MENTIYSEKISAGRRTYFLDVKETTDGSKYLKITETKHNKGERERNIVLVFEEDIYNFSNVFCEAIKKFGNQIENIDNEIIHISQWKKTEELRLIQLYRQGVTIFELSKIFDKTMEEVENHLKNMGL
ncbi:MAG: DUF3276 family protein [Cytophagales bacterium]|nr:MAG: DUF3276 family protein [Cytophagales bacterium]